jgi:predicted ester cyclase
MHTAFMVWPGRGAATDPLRKHDVPPITDGACAVVIARAKTAALAAPELAVHAALIDGSPSSALRGPEGQAAMITQIRAAFPNLTFTTEVGPLRDGDFLIGRWRADGHYVGGFPGATAAAGAPIAFTGTDTLRLHDGRLVEYWLNGDTLDLLRQLGTVA